MNSVIWQPGVTLDAMEKQVILTAYRFYRGNKTQTAKSLGIAIRTLDNKLEIYEKADEAVKKSEQESQNEHAEFLKAQRGEPSTWRPKPVSPFIPRKTKPIEGAGANGSSSESGLHMESAQRASEEQQVPLPIGNEVQGVLSKQASGHRSNKRR